jgi:hypothetical protein|nr:propionyl-CoA carboxylase beta chain [uncultured bacterium]
MFSAGEIGLKLERQLAEWGSLPVEGGVAAAYKRQISAAADPKQRERELEPELRELTSPFRTAEAFGVEDIIDLRPTCAASSMPRSCACAPLSDRSSGQGC